MAISYIYPPTGEPVTREPWRWVAVYTDGSSLEQFEVKAGKATFHRFAEIEQERLANFLMVHDTHPALTLRFDPASMELQHFYRHQHLETPTGNRDADEQEIVEISEPMIYYFGYRDKTTGRYHLTGILPDNGIIISNALHHLVDLAGK